MKLICSSILMFASVATAFSPSSSVPAFSRISTQRSMIPDGDIMNHLAQHAADAVNVVLQNCDDEGCILVDGVKTGDGSWMFENRMGGDWEPTAGRSSNVVMMAMEDTE
mmetsp:Transcript_46763/g.69162  ORF Transcript_46763/g.69162 Transcript_46763/m.69162 type:complete len:109 (+) Transcript_46763:88-414(+)|eukprot:CAMPEP_0195508446 /NCGR_PEP_ID=MMETSP0794_2-20130614/1651_1 /TAXON_ID=515487 /ORGANISM="Stephanopyxis turris, Strain CCMP 815" /LENGTH=108 /DNA_ID=CAMNT_0040635409 /DNA_START=80 /DNA_END=406 /DNA_ORIENTATION=+